MPSAPRDPADDRLEDLLRGTPLLVGVQRAERSADCDRRRLTWGAPEFMETLDAFLRESASWHAAACRAARG